MTTFALVSQSLRTAEPLHQILPTSLLDRLLHHAHRLPKPAEEEGASGTDRTAGDAGFGGAAGVNAGVVGTGRPAPAALIAEIFGAPTGT